MRNVMITVIAVLILLVIYLFPTVIVPFLLMLVLHAFGYAIGFGTCFLAIILFRWALKQILKAKRHQ
ncbi:MAG: hypothetical protein K0S71_308 [Clostridia bacterium]|jgi:hypothetical protein|nr:hypothetical protein [Clostridia bacterium]